MERDAINDLVKWEVGHRRKPLIVESTRQVGKTWLVKEFARLHYKCSLCKKWVRTLIPKKTSGRKLFASAKMQN